MEPAKKMKMTESDKSAELKKAYEDILPNTTKKEATDKVIAAEKKAAEYLEEVVRLKQMCEAKMKEAEEKSITQQSKIALVEAQLHEAEDVVVDLRAQLEDLPDRVQALDAQVKYLMNEVQALDAQREYLMNEVQAFNARVQVLNARVQAFMGTNTGTISTP